MKKKCLSLALALVVALGLSSCAVRYSTDIEVKDNSGNTYIYYHNGYKAGDVTITPTEDGGYDVTVHVQAGETRRAP